MADQFTSLHKEVRRMVTWMELLTLLLLVVAVVAVCLNNRQNK